MKTLRGAWPGESLLLALRDPIALMARMTALGEDVVRVRLGARVFYLLCDPVLIREALAHSGGALRKERALRLAGFVFGNGLLTSEGDRHREQRRRLRPVFERQRVDAQAAVVVECTRATLARWRDGDLIDLPEQMRALTLDVTSQALFGGRLGARMPAFLQAVDVATRGFERHHNPLAGLLQRLPLPGTVRLWRARETIRSMTAALLEEGDGPVPEALRTCTDRELALDEAVTLLLAGHATTAVALAWACHLVAGSEHVRRRLQDEADAAAGAGEIGPDALPSLRYTRQVVSEALRLRPPVWALPREVVHDVRLGAHRFPRGAVLMVAPVALHHDARWWPAPERFDPDRFSDPERIAPFTFLPFGAGSRGCVGESMAWSECVLALALIARSWQLEIEPRESLVVRPGITLRPWFRMRVRARRHAGDAAIPVAVAGHERRPLP